MSTIAPPVDDFTPRNFQKEMLKICLQKNTIIYLPTGAGKTHIALMAIKELAKGAGLDRPLTEGGKRTFFVVNTVALAKQQRDFIDKNVPYDTTVYTSDRNIDAWKGNKWLEEFAKYQIIICTVQILLDILKHGYLSLKHINLLIFDECHHGLGDHPMHGVMEMFLKVPKADQPRVIGLSGMLLYRSLKTVDAVKEELLKLENTFYSTIATVGSYDKYTEVCQFSTDPNEQLLPYSVTMPSLVEQEITASVNSFLTTVVQYHLPKYSNVSKALLPTMPKPKKEIEKMMKEVLYQISDLGLFGGSIAVLGAIIKFEMSKRTSDSLGLRTLFRYCITFCESLHHKINRHMEGMTVEDKVYNFSSIKLRQLMKYLKESSSKTETKTLIFVERRYSAKVLYHMLKMYFSNSEATDSIIPDFIVGSNAFIPESIESILCAQRDRKVLHRFSRGETNTIVTTSVLEEGIDLQMCNTVIKFDKPKTFASYEQSKGRARMKNSNYCIMLNATDRREFLEKYTFYKQLEKELQTSLIGKTINRPDPLDSDVYEELNNESIPPFFTKKGAKLDALSAIQLLNRYCMTMPRDAFTNTNISWERKDLPSGKVLVQIMLPLQSTVRDKIAGQPSVSIKQAKRSAAFEACRKLYEAGELNEHLVPIDAKRQLINVESTYFEHWKEFSADSSKEAGTNKSVRSHAIKYPQQTAGCFPQAGKPCFIYVLRMDAGFSDETNENVEVFRSLFNNSNNYGIMTTKPLPRLAKMKFFITLGLINVQVDEHPITLSDAGSDVELEMLRNFHVTLFQDVLKLWKQFLVYDYSNGNDSYLIVPMKGSTGIDWELVRSFQFMEEAPTELTTVARARMNFDPDQYRHSVVLPWYKNNQDCKYVVTQVHEHLTPQSAFPNPEYSSYEDYFVRSYHLSVVRKDQFLIEVKGITTSLNRLNPGSEMDGKSARSKHWRFSEKLIPELCHNYQFPADYWLQATILPSVLHRLHYLLLSENIRVELATAVKVGCLQNAVIEDLDVEFQRSKTVDIDSINTKYNDDDDNDDEDDDDDDDEDAEMINDNDLPKAIDLKQLMCTQIEPLTMEAGIPWSAEEEPMDIDRNWDNTTKLDLDYYDTFIRKFDGLNIVDQVSDNIHASYKEEYYAASPQKKAIVDAPLQEKFKISLLEKTPQSTANVSLQQKDIIKALTAKKSSDVFDLERFELLGDAFLKFATSFYLLKAHPDWHEGFLTVVKGQIVSNRNLVYCAMRMGLPGMLKVHPFDPRNDWQPPLATVPKNIIQMLVEGHHQSIALYQLELDEVEKKTGAMHSENVSHFIGQLDTTPNPYPDISSMQNYLGRQSMGDKTPADAMEALLGVCLNAVGTERSFNLLPFLGILPKQDLSGLLKDKICSRNLLTGINNREVDDFIPQYPRIEKVLGYTFKNRAYLLQALTHASYPTNRITGSYQQLEFLGDAVLDYLVVNYTFERNPTMSPGQLTDLRSALVNNVTLACILVRHGLHMYILSDSASFSDAVSRFVVFQEKQRHRITDQVNLLVEEVAPFAEFVDVPKALGDVFESLIGAVFLDSGNDLQTAWNVIYGLMHAEILEFTEKTPIQVVRQLYEFTPDCHPVFSKPIVDDDVVMVKCSFKMRGVKKTSYGFGTNKDDAKRAAAKGALRELRFKQ
ncbi:endoribonuclease dcr-1 [Uranotaenia lowii]|uniref:endoribonuclease dcr-1 n=1 Tax=Uranotaenia lowii TaxID=190385 RepID=UPI00247A9DE5|nr:endoribonuclease dcr-1 [Uranotaenia lowii]